MAESSVQTDNLVVAAEAGDVEAVQEAINTGVNLNAISAKRHNSAIAVAAMRGQLRVVRLLIDHGASPEACDNMPALCWAARQGYESIVSFLLNAGALVDGTDVMGETPLMCAAEKAQADCVQLLIKAGANVNAVSVMEKTPLSQAFDYEWRYRKRNQVIDILLAAGAELGIWEKTYGNWKRPDE